MKGSTKPLSSGQHGLDLGDQEIDGDAVLDTLRNDQVGMALLGSTNSRCMGLTLSRY